MSYHNGDPRPSRPRANTGAFTTFANWRRGGKPDVLPTVPDTPPLSFDALIEALTPPAVPSLSHARALAAAIPTHAPKPRLAALSPILGSLCAADSPSSLQAAGFDILSAYWFNTKPQAITTADKLACLSLMLDLTHPWLPDIWEPRLKALLAFTHSGEQTIGVESSVLRVIGVWVRGAFDGLIQEATPDDERLERQRSIETVIGFLLNLLGRQEFVARLTAADVTSVLQFYGGLIDKALAAAPTLRPVPLQTVFVESSPSRKSSKHGRHPSSASMTSPVRHPVDFAVNLFLDYLGVRLEAIAPDHLKTIFPYLLRALSFYASPLPRLSLRPSSILNETAEKRISEVIDSLVTGPCSAASTLLLKCSLFPSHDDLTKSVQTCLGALRTLRVSIRRALISRLARSYISKTSSVTYTPSGAPGRVDLDRDIVEQAWAKDDIGIWGFDRFRRALCRSVKAWVDFRHDEPTVTSLVSETVLMEVAGILKDMNQAFDEASDGEDLDSEEVETVGQILRELVRYMDVQAEIDGAPIVLDLNHPNTQTPFLAILSSLLGQDLLISPLYAILPSVALPVAQHISDPDIAQLLSAMSDRQMLSPTSPQWLDHWDGILSIPGLYTQQWPLTRQISMNTLQAVWEFVKDIPEYRQPLATLAFGIWKQNIPENRGYHTSIVIWRILGDEVALRNAEAEITIQVEGIQGVGSTPDDILEFLIDIAFKGDVDEVPTPNVSDARTSSYPPSVSSLTTTPVTPMVTRMHSEAQYATREPETPVPSVMSLLSSLTSGNLTRPRPQPPRLQSPEVLVQSPTVVPQEVTSVPRPVGAAVALITSFSQLAFTTGGFSDSHVDLAVRIFQTLVSLLSSPSCSRAKITALQFLMRLRVDRDHRLYYASAGYDRDGQIFALCSQIGRAERPLGSRDERPSEESDIRRARTRVPQERNGRKSSRGAGGQASNSEASRSRSRAPSRILPFTSTKIQTTEPLWSIPESLPFSVSAEADTPSEGLISFDPAGPAGRVVLPLSSFLAKIVEIIKTEKDWEVLSYVLCHLPTQLANKHLFCGPKSRDILSDLLKALCSGILEGNLATEISSWPEGLVPRDAHGLAFYTLTVLISYKRRFRDVQMLHRLVEVFLVGLNGQPSSIKCCLHALSLSAFELKPSMTKFLSRILEKLSQIMSNPTMAVHIIDFLSIVGSLRELHTNFTDSDYKMVFGVALQYLQHHNRADEALPISFALSQHVRIMSYYIVYLWFLAVDLPDRKKHIPFIARQLHLANDERPEVDEPAEVCFDWLARYTFASADPRPANSMLAEIIMNPAPSKLAPEPALSEKTWVLGNSVVTIRALTRRGWIEVLSRRPSGLTKFLCKAENVPLVTPGDVDPDLLSMSAGLILDRESQTRSLAPGTPGDSNSCESLEVTSHNFDEAPRDAPDPITGYVWSGTAPSQRRKDVAIDPSFFALQLSCYPGQATVDRVLVEPTKLPAFARNLDRMPVIDTHKVGIMYVAPGQKRESGILLNSHGSPAYTRFLEGLGRLINLRGQLDVYDGGLDPDEDGEYAYAWWDDIGQVLFHTATLMPSVYDDRCTNKKRHIGNDYVRIVWNDSGSLYRFDTLSTQFQFVNIVIESHSRGAIAAYSNNLHENEYFKVTVQRAPGMTEFTPVGEFKLISAENLPLLVRQLSLLADWFVSVWQHTKADTVREEMPTNWRSRLQAIKRFRSQVSAPREQEGVGGFRDFTNAY